MAEFNYSDLLPIGTDQTEYRQISKDGVSTFEADGKTFLKVAPEALEKLTAIALHDINHYLRAEHLNQLKRILDDPEASANDRFVALDLLKNANISAGGVLPMCQDTGTAIIMGKKGQQVLTSERDEVTISRGVYDAYTKLSSNVTITKKTVGASTTIQVSKSLGFVPAVGDRIELVGFSDDSSNGYMFS